MIECKGYQKSNFIRIYKSLWKKKTKRKGNLHYSTLNIPCEDNTRNKIEKARRTKTNHINIIIVENMVYLIFGSFLVNISKK